MSKTVQPLSKYAKSLPHFENGCKQSGPGQVAGPPFSPDHAVIKLCEKSAGDFFLEFIQNFLGILTQQDPLLRVDDALLDIDPLGLCSGIELGAGNQTDPVSHGGISSVKSKMNEALKNKSNKKTSTNNGGGSRGRFIKARVID